jgi:hypothetical protein
MLYFKSPNKGFDLPADRGHEYSAKLTPGQTPKRLSRS